MKIQGKTYDWYDVFFWNMLILLVSTIAILLTLPFWSNHPPT